jgi:hypothetical protein
MFNALCCAAKERPQLGKNAAHSSIKGVFCEVASYYNNRGGAAARCGRASGRADEVIE